jgi:hypothetical protein
MDLIRLKNEESIAVGNAGTNARGDKLGKGGQIVRTRQELMRDYHKMNTPIAQEGAVHATAPKEVAVPDIKMPDPLKPMEPTLKTPIPQEAPVEKTIKEVKAKKKKRGKLADTIANKKSEDSNE